MTSLIDKLHPVFENRIRLGIMSTLLVGPPKDFTTLRALLGVTDGNLASHIKVLEEKGFVTVTKEFVGRKPQTTYAVTKAGRHAFLEHLEGLEQVLRHRP